MRAAAGRVHGAPSLAARLATRAAGVARVLRTVLGAPDYDAYVAHLRVHHPGTTPPTREQFVDARLRERYERPGARCC